MNNNTIPPSKRPKPIGKSTFIFKEEIADKYNEYLPKIISITVLLTPGIITPADIAKPVNTSSMNDTVFASKEERFPENSILIKYKLKEKVNNKQIILINLKLCLPASLKILGILPKISPIKQKHAIVWKLEYM